MRNRPSLYFGDKQEAIEKRDNNTMQTRRMVLVFCCKVNPYFIRIILFKTLIFQIANSQPVTRGANKLYFALIRNDLHIFAPTNHNKPKYDNNYFFISWQLLIPPRLMVRQRRCIALISWIVRAPKMRRIVPGQITWLVII